MKWFSFVLLMVAMGAHAGENDALTPNPKLTLREVLERTFERNPQRHVLQAMDGEVQARYLQARGMLPMTPALSVRHQNDAVGSGRGEREWEAELELPVWLPGQRAARHAVAQESQLELAATRDALMLQLAGVLRDAVWDVEMNLIAVKLAQQRLESARVLQRDVERRFEAGELAKTDVMLAQNETLQAQAALLRVEAELRHAQHRYRVLTGSDEIPAFAEEPLSKKQTVDDQHPFMREMEHKIAMARNQRELALIERRDNPQLMLSARSQRGAFDNAYNDSIGLKLRIPFPTESQTASRIAAAESQLAAKLTEQERLQQALQTALHEAEHNLATTQAELEIVTRQQQLAHENLRLAKKAFELGETDLVHVIRVQALTHEADRLVESRKVQLKWDISKYNQSVGELP
jgi:outer membrane protein TolC